MDTDELIDELEAIGLTEYQSRTYIATVSLGSARFSALADEAGVPQQRVYDVIDDLQEMGLVEVHENSGGKRAVSISPEDALTELKRRHVESFESSVDRAVEQLRTEFETTEPSAGFVATVSSDSSFLRHARNAIDAAEWWLFLSLTPRRCEELAAEITAASDRGVTVRLLVLGDDVTTAPIDEFQSDVQIRRRRWADTIVAADRHYGIFRGISSPVLSRATLVTRDETIVTLIQRYSRLFWTGSDELVERRSFPRRYLSPQQVLSDIPDVADGEYWAVVEGYEIDSGDSRVLAGKVVEFEWFPAAVSEYDIVLPTVVNLTIETEDDRVTVGGFDAVAESVGATGIEIHDGLL